MQKHEGIKYGAGSGVGGVRLGRTLDASPRSRFQCRNIESRDTNLWVHICQIEHV